MDRIIAIQRDVYDPKRKQHVFLLADQLLETIGQHHTSGPDPNETQVIRPLVSFHDLGSHPAERPCNRLLIHQRLRNRRHT